MKISFYESHVDIICDWFTGGHVKDIQFVQKMYLYARYIYLEGIFWNMNKIKILL